MVGVTVFLTVLLFAAELSIGLYATSAVNGVGFDAARSVAAGGSVEAAEANVRRVLGRFERGGGRLTLRWTDDVDAVVLTMTAERPSLLPGVHLPFERIERTVRVRREGVR